MVTNVRNLENKEKNVLLKDNAEALQSVTNVEIVVLCQNVLKTLIAKNKVTFAKKDNVFLTSGLI